MEICLQKILQIFEINIEISFKLSQLCRILMVYLCTEKDIVFHGHNLHCGGANRY